MASGGPSRPSDETDDQLSCNSPVFVTPLESPIPLKPKVRSSSMFNYLSGSHGGPVSNHRCLAFIWEDDPRLPAWHPLRRHSDSPTPHQVPSFYQVPLNSTPRTSEVQLNDPLLRRSSTPVSLTSSSGSFCRICQDGEAQESLISPCRCTGSIALVHRSCIERWISTKNLARCEICHFEFAISLENPPLHQWLRNPAHFSDRRNLIGDSVCFFLLTPLAAVSVWLCCSGALHFMRKEPDNQWEVAGLASLSVFLIIIYLIWCIVVLRYHFKVFREWRQRNLIVHVAELAEDAKRDRVFIDINNNVDHHLVPLVGNPTSSNADFLNRMQETWL